MISPSSASFCAAMMLAACGGPAPVSSPLASPASERVERSSEGPEARGAHAQASAGKAPHSIFVARDYLLLDGVRISGAGVHKVDLVQPLFDALRPLTPRGGLPTDSPTPGSEHPRPFESTRSYELRVQGDTPMVWLKSAFQTAAFAGTGPAVLSISGRSFLLRPRVPLHPDEVAEEFPDPALVIAVRENGTELWLVRQGAESGSAFGAIPAAQLAATVSASELEAAFARECAQINCSPAMLFASDTVYFEQVRPILAAFAASASGAGRSVPVLEFRVNSPPSRPVAPGPLPRLPRGETALSKLGRKQIQSTVRANFEPLRECYVEGLKSDPALAGRLDLNFVIDHDGSVLAAKVANHDFPEPVSQCVLGVFRGLVFPPPEGGVVSVTYPVHFQPE